MMHNDHRAPLPHGPRRVALRHRTLPRTLAPPLSLARGYSVGGGGARVCGGDRGGGVVRETITCPGCNGDGGVTMTEPQCCGNFYPHGDCRQHCAVPVQVPYPCETCNGSGEIETPEPCTIEANSLGCTCRMSSTHSASIDPPEPIMDPRCPVHSNYDVDFDMELRREDRDREEDSR